MATPNMDAINEASELVSQMYNAIKLFEDGEITVGEFTFPLTEANITAIKQEFAADRLACIAALQSITANGS